MNLPIITHYLDKRPFFCVYPDKNIGNYWCQASEDCSKCGWEKEYYATIKK